MAVADFQVQIGWVGQSTKMADTSMMIKEVTGVKEEEGVDDKKIIKTLDETFSCSTYVDEGQPLLGYWQGG